MLEKLRSESATRIELEFLCGLGVENLAKPIGPGDESVTSEKGRVAALPLSHVCRACSTVGRDSFVYLVAV